MAKIEMQQNNKTSTVLYRSLLSLLILFLGLAVKAEAGQTKWKTQEVGNMIINIDSADYGIGVLKKGVHSPLVELVDKNSDGVVDLLRYLVLDENDNKIFLVEDSEMDGILDQRTVFDGDKIKAIEVPFQGIWYTIHTQDGKHFIEVVGNTIPLEYQGGIFKVAPDN